MHSKVTCSVCDFDYTHILGIIEVKDNDNYQVVEFVVNGHYTITASQDYVFRSQGNLHIMFRCEDGHFFINSFDGHKGMVFFNENPLMKELEVFLNKHYAHENYLSFNYSLLAAIEEFLNLES